MSVIAALAGVADAADCAPYPVVSKIRNVTLSNGAVSRGVAFSVGEPPQDIAFAPRWPTNNIMIYGSNGYCAKDPEYTGDACLTWRGGRYDPQASNSSGALQSNAIPPESNDATYRVLDFVKDTVQINENTSLPDFAIGIPNKDAGNGYQPLAGFGLGPQSTILGSLKESGRIASRTWSIFYGWMGENRETQLDGTFVFGGYDRAKVSGEEYSLRMAELGSECSTRMMVTINDVALNFPNGTEVSLFDDGTRSMDACILPRYPVALSLGGRRYEKLAGLIGANTSLGYGLVYNGQVFDPGSTPFEGDLTVRLRYGPTIRIPNHQLVQPDRVVDEESGELVTNNDTRVLAIKNLGRDSPTLPHLGKQFLAAAYLMANLDTEMFTLWEANPTDQEDLVAVDEKGEEISTFCTSAAGGDGGPNPSETPGNAEPAASGGSLSTGATAGIAVGVVGAAAVLAVAAFFLLRRRRRRTTAAELASTGEPQPHHELGPAHMYKAEMGEPGTPKPSPLGTASELSATTAPQMLSSASVSPDHRVNRAELA